MKKYELTENYIIFNGRKLFQIKALISFGDVKPGDLGGYIEKERNLSQWDDNAWVSDNAVIYGNAKICGNAAICGNTVICDNAIIKGNAKICGDINVGGYANICGNAAIQTNKDYTYIRGFGSEYRTTTFFRLDNKDIGVCCGCFYGTLNEFRKKVKETHNDNKYAKEYLMIADLMEYHFSNNKEINTYENSN